MVPEHHQQPLDMLEIHIFNACLTCVCAQVCVELLATPWTVACQTPLSMGFLRQEYWSGLHFLLPTSQLRTADRLSLS